MTFIPGLWLEPGLKANYCLLGSLHPLVPPILPPAQEDEGRRQAAMPCSPAPVPPPSPPPSPAPVTAAILFLAGEFHELGGRESAEIRPLSRPQVNLLLRPAPAPLSASNSDTHAAVLRAGRYGNPTLSPPPSQRGSPKSAALYP